jgi:hypothetical protein
MEQATTAAEQSAGERRPALGSQGNVAELDASRAWRRRDYALLGGVGLLLGLRRAEGPPDTDILWSARYGKDVLSSGHLPHSDTYSWTASGRSWVPNSWAWNVVLGAGYRIAGIFGLWLVGIGLAVGLSLMLGRAAARIGAAPMRTAMVVAVLGVFVLVVVPRAQAVGYIFMLCLPPLLRPILYGNRTNAFRAAVTVCAIQVVWMNLHSSAILGPAIVACGGTALLVGSRQPLAAVRGAIGRLVAVVALAAAACLATPYGAVPALHIAAVRRASVGLINEWDRPGIGNLAQTVSLAAMIGAAVLAVVAWRAGRFDTAAILVLLAVATGSAIRFGPMLAAFAIPELALALGKLNVRPYMLRRTLAAGCVALVALIAARLEFFAKLDDQSASRGLVTALPHGCRLVNDYVVGAAVILFRPDVMVSTDSRIDMYGRAKVLSNGAVINLAPGAIDYLDRNAVTCVLVYSQSRLVKSLSVSSGWREVGKDSVRTLLVRTAG